MGWYQKRHNCRDKAIYILFYWLLPLYHCLLLAHYQRGTFPIGNPFVGVTNLIPYIRNFLE